MVYSEYIGVTQEVSSLIETHRHHPRETKSDILIRILQSIENIKKIDIQYTGNKYLDIGQGVRLKIGEKIYLFLDSENLKNNTPDGVAEAREDGLYVDNKKVNPSRKSVIQPAMDYFKKIRGKRTSQSAYRQWHVYRDRKFVQLADLKDPNLSLKRGTRRKLSDITLEELGLA